MSVFKEDADHSIDAARLAVMETDFFQHLARTMTSENSEVGIKGLESMRELLKYGQLVTSLVINSPDMF